jgi:dUTP pyrophosphatase
MEVVLLSPTATCPQRQTPGSAGYDLVASESTVILSGKRKLVGTGLQISIPSNCYGRIAPRSSLAWKNQVDIGAGVIDSDYRGEVKVLLVNNGSDFYQVNIGDRIAQLILTRIETPEIIVVGELSSTSRGSGGFGSTGTN